MFVNLISKLPFSFQFLATEVFWVLYFFFPIYFPFFLGYIAWNLWLGYKRFNFILKQDRVLLELKLPKEIKKTPLAMEIFLNAVHQTGGEGTWYVRNILGKSRTWFSLELVSFAGQVKFFIWAEKKFKKLLEASLYSQYPEVEIYEVSDYTKQVDFDPKINAMWGNEFVLTKADPYPIKTYVDYGLEKPGVKDEEKTDPMTAMIEFLGSVGEGEQLWFQILVRAHKKNYKKELEWLEKLKKKKWSDSFDWTEVGKKEVESLIEKLKSGENIPPRAATKGEESVILSIERNIEKIAFDCGIRGIYFAEKNKFDPINITGVTASFKQYSSMTLNGFRPNNVTDFDFPWQDYKKIRVNKKKKEMLGLYRRRAYFYWPYKNKKQFVLSSEELATIYHLPGAVSQTPSFVRVASKKSVPPENLPF